MTSADELCGVSSVRFRLGALSGNWLDVKVDGRPDVIIALTTDMVDEEGRFCGVVVVVVGSGGGLLLPGKVVGVKSSKYGLLSASRAVMRLVWSNVNID